MRRYEVTITGQTPLLMHADNIEWADRMGRWAKDPANSKKSVKGDDRAPAFRWIGCLYHDAEQIALPADNLMRCLMEGGAMVPVPGGRSGKTFKAQTQSGCMVGEPYWPLLVRGKAVGMAGIRELVDQPDFQAHQDRAAELGFLLYVKRAKVGQNKHVRVRPRFDAWSAIGTMNVWDDQLTTDVLRDVLTYAGQYKGLGDWRPGSPSRPGPHGMFNATLKEIR